jgi:hypothetical protein
LFNQYKLYLDLNIIFDSQQDFLYRQKGQLKLDNTVIEEFLPHFIRMVLGSNVEQYNLTFGPKTCFSSIYFASTVTASQAGGGLRLRQKDHDFVLSRPLYIQAAHNSQFSNSVVETTNIAYLALECKTNLDKTMFQEAAASALDLKTSVPTAKYYLLCEWLDMTPINSSITAIDEVIILRKAKRLSSTIRDKFSTYAGRQAYRAEMQQHLVSNPFSVEMFTRIANHIARLFEDSSEDTILNQGHF